MTYMPCTCGHARGAHRSAGTAFPHPPRYGICLAPNCACREYVNAERAAGEDDPQGDLAA